MNRVVRVAIAGCGLAALPLLAAAAPGAIASIDEVEEQVEEAEEQAESTRERLREAEEAADVSRQEAEEAQARVVEHQEAFDEAVAAYEEARGHYEQVAGERDREVDRVEAAAEAQAEQATSFGEHLAEVYKRPPQDLGMIELVLASEDAADALHRADLVGRAAELGADRLLAARDLEERTTDEAQQHHVVAVGLDDAADRLQETQEQLDFALANAEEAAARAESDAIRAEQAAAEAGEDLEEVEGRVEAARDRVQAVRRRVEAAEAAEDAEPPPAVDGMVCPIGSPHGFTDSWLAPRPGGRQHQGIDMFAEHGMPIYAVEDGQVRTSSNRLGGLVIYLTADDGDRYYYAHLSELHVDTGNRVEAGEQIGANGDTGNARGTPPHLHWELRVGGDERVNPYPLARDLCSPDGPGH
ncbi:M23 family metallopeptidase [Egibacter rhizosphaerae]|uniref:M23 family metallopeptidase n=1 Tax=Egibacter rhizosphaerae TaxID=1670831 RepID=A0A411YG90_9ACTN|nr:M23 family metallopeptidase [Egibacter rhizosphaerae]QBI20250.1 M23 family metallopeptidase [Egibacter rhizosphaerae]